MARRVDDVDAQTVCKVGEVHEDRYVWTEHRERAIELFREAPSAVLEAEILGEFGVRPALVVSTIESVARGVAAGTIRSGWAILRSRLASASAGLELVVVDPSERERRIKRAEGWLLAAGVHFDREAEVLDVLFEAPGERSEPVLGPWRSDAALREQMVERWRELRWKVPA